MSPFSSTIEGGRSAPAECCGVSTSAAAVAVEDARIHRLGCRLPLLQLPPPSRRLLEAERPGHAARRRRGRRTAAALGTKAAAELLLTPESALAATDLRGSCGGCQGSLSATQNGKVSKKERERSTCSLGSVGCGGFLSKAVYVVLLFVVLPFVVLNVKGSA